MKNSKILFLSIGIWFLSVFLHSLLSGYSNISETKEDEKEHVSESPMDTYIHNEFKVCGTHYHPVKSQCWGDPLVTASNSFIDTNLLIKGEIRWVALSRDLLSRWGGHFNYGDTIFVNSKNEDFNGLWVVKDCMNKRFKNRIDFLCHPSQRGIGKEKNIIIYKWQTKDLG